MRSGGSAHFCRFQHYHPLERRLHIGTLFKHNTTQQRKKIFQNTRIMSRMDSLLLLSLVACKAANRQTALYLEVKVLPFKDKHPSCLFHSHNRSRFIQPESFSTSSQLAEKPAGGSGYITMHTWQIASNGSTEQMTLSHDILLFQGQIIKSSSLLRCSRSFTDDLLPCRLSPVVLFLARVSSSSCVERVGYF